MSKWTFVVYRLSAFQLYSWTLEPRVPYRLAFEECVQDLTKNKREIFIIADYPISVGINECLYLILNFGETLVRYYLTYNYGHMVVWVMHQAQISKKKSEKKFISYWYGKLITKLTIPSVTIAKKLVE